jgi:hypothetical protein
MWYLTYWFLVSPIAYTRILWNENNSRVYFRAMHVLMWLAGLLGPALSFYPSLGFPLYTHNVPYLFVSIHLYNITINFYLTVSPFKQFHYFQVIFNEWGETLKLSHWIKWMKKMGSQCDVLQNFTPNVKNTYSLTVPCNWEHLDILKKSQL